MDHDLHGTLNQDAEKAVSSMTYIDSSTELPPIASKHVTANTNEFVMSLPEVQSRHKQASIDQADGMGGQSQAYKSLNSKSSKIFNQVKTSANDIH